MSAGTFSSIFGEKEPEMALSHESIAESLLKEGFLLTALEFHTELLESGKELNVLKDFFSESKNFRSIEDVHGPLQSPETPSKGGRRSAPGTSDISRAGSQLTLDSIDQLTRCCCCLYPTVVLKHICYSFLMDMEQYIV